MGRRGRPDPPRRHPPDALRRRLRCVPRCPPHRAGPVARLAARRAGDGRALAPRPCPRLSPPLGRRLPLRVGRPGPAPRRESLRLGGPARVAALGGAAGRRLAHGHPQGVHGRLPAAVGDGLPAGGGTARLGHRHEGVRRRRRAGPVGAAGPPPPPAPAAPRAAPRPRLEPAGAGRGRGQRPQRRFRRAPADAVAGRPRPRRRPRLRRRGGARSADEIPARPRRPRLAAALPLVAPGGRAGPRAAPGHPLRHRGAGAVDEPREIRAVLALQPDAVRSAGRARRRARGGGAAGRRAARRVRARPGGAEDGAGRRRARRRGRLDPPRAERAPLVRAMAAAAARAAGRAGPPSLHGQRAARLPRLSRMAVRPALAGRLAGAGPRVRAVRGGRHRGLATAASLGPREGAVQ